jgi:hypothetical protein
MEASATVMLAILRAESLHQIHLEQKLPFDFATGGVR